MQTALGVVPPVEAVNAGSEFGEVVRAASIRANFEIVVVRGLAGVRKAGGRLGALELTASAEPVVGIEGRAVGGIADPKLFEIVSELLAEGWTPVREAAAAFSARIGCVVWLVLVEKGAAAG